MYWISLPPAAGTLGVPVLCTVYGRGVFFIVHSTGTPRVPAAGSRDIQYIYPAQRRFSAEMPKLVDAAGDQGGAPDHEDL